MLAVGIKATCDWLDRPEWLRFAADVGDPLEVVQLLGVSYSEFSFWGRSTSSRWSADSEAQLVLDASRRVIDAGMQVHLHPYVHQDQRGPGYFVGDWTDPVTRHLEVAIDIAAELAQAQGSSTTIVFHPADNPITAEGEKNVSEHRQLLLRRSKEFFQYGEEYAARTCAPVSIVCEMPPPSSIRLRTGETPAELLEVIAGTNAGICWDTGHFSMCAAKHGFPEFPNAAFLRQVGHVHIHRVENGKDHLPIVPDDGYIDRCVESMWALERPLRVTLEYPYGEDAENGEQDAWTVLNAGVRAVMR